ncbi:MAG: NAD(P)H-dependent oxidoreductase [Pseudomonadota bacterium]
MNVLIVYTHPVKKSFNRAILDAVSETLVTNGHEVRVADLYVENFQPAMIEADFAQFENKPMPDDVLAEQARIDWSDAMIFIFPYWWWSIPAMLKGWIDRVLTYGYAWVDPMRPDLSPLRARKILVLTTAGASLKALAKRGYDTAFETQLNTGVWSYCGFNNVVTRMYECVTSELPQSVLHGYIRDAQKQALRLVSPVDPQQ